MEGDKPETKDQEKGERGRGRGGRGRGRGGRGRGRGGRGGGRGGRNNPDNMNKDSYYFKYQFGPWPEFEKIEVKIDTELPPIKPKEERLKEPDMDEFKKRMNDLNEQINKKKEKIQAINKEK